jgi:predicted MFS family arabinose efflux permease
MTAPLDIGVSYEIYEFNEFLSDDMPGHGSGRVPPRDETGPGTGGDRALLRLLTLCAVAGSFSTRSLEPVVVVLAGEFLVPVTAAALLSTAFALAYGFVQPVLGPLGDLFGKVRVLIICLWLLGLMLTLAALAPSYEFLLITRTLAGAAAGGTFPLVIAIIGDRLSVTERQVALSRIMAGAVTGQLLGSITAGFLADSAGWRMALGSAAALAALAAAVASLRLRDAGAQPQGSTGLAAIRAGYGMVFRSKAALICYAAVFVEGLAVFGFLPFVGVLLLAQGAGPLQAGIVIEGVAGGGIAFALVVRRMMRILPGMALMRAGGVVAAIALVALALQPVWQLQALLTALLGFGYNMMHNTLQTRVTEVAPQARALSVSWHALSFFLGQASGPVIFGALFFAFGATPAILAFAVTVLVGGVGGAAALDRVRARG